MFTKKQIIISVLLCLIPLIPGIIFYSQMPDSVPTHFGLNGEPDGYSSKVMTVFGMPLLLAALDAFSLFFVSADPKRANIGGPMRQLMLWVVPAVGVLCAAAIYPAALGHKMNMSRLVMIFVGLVFLIMGNYMPKVKQNYTAGIKLPWTLNSEENWIRTHRFAGYLWMACGLLMIALGITGLLNVAAVIAIAGAAGVVPMIYSYLLYKKGI